LCAALWVAAPGPLEAAPSPLEAAAELDRAAVMRVDAVSAEWLKSTGAPSVSIAIVERGALKYAKAFGLARLRPKTPTGPEVRYAIDSISKEFTAAAVLLLAQRGKLSLDDRLDRWLENLGPASEVTLRQVLTHTGGIRDYWPEDFVTPEMREPTSTQAIIREWADRPLDFPPGSDWQYSNTGYVLAGAVVERVAGESLFEYLRKNVFAPLRMAQVADYDKSTGTGDALGYTRYGLGPVHPAPREAAGWLFGAAGLAMPPAQLALWDISLIDRSLLEASSYELEFMPVRLANGTSYPYGLGLHVSADSGGRLLLSHAGAGSGFMAENRIWPHERVAIAIATNNDWASPGDLADRIAFIVLRPSAAQARASALFEAFQGGTVDRSQFTDAGRSYLTDELLAESRSSLSPLGPARIVELEREQKRGGMVTRVWKILCRDTRLRAIERDAADGRVAEFMITKRND
jgi:CubicO group peptidase (beta-lactamase class C family)